MSCTKEWLESGHRIKLLSSYFLRLAALPPHPLILFPALDGFLHWLRALFYWLSVDVLYRYLHLLF